MDIYTVFCIVLGEATPFSVKIPKDDTVDYLKDLIKEKKSHKLKDIDANTLVLYKVDIFEDEKLAEKMKNWQADAIWLKPSRKLFNIFENTLKDETIHIVVVPPKLPGAQKRPRDQDTVSNEPPRKRLKPVQPSSVSPLKVAKDSELNDNFHYGCPLRPGSIPLALLHEVFGQFAEDVQKCTPSKADNLLVSQLRGEMVKVYDKETDIVRAFRRAWENRSVWEDGNNIGFKLEAAQIGSYTTDGHFRVGEFYVIIAEGKRGLQGMNSDPLLQAAMYYLEGLNYVPKEVPDRLPCLLIYYAGPYIGFAGIIWTTDVQVEVLTPFYPLHGNVHETTMLMQVTRAISAAKKAIRTLAQHYYTLDQQPSQAISQPSISFPYRTHYHSPEEVRVEFHYLQRLHNTKLVFLAETTQKKYVFIKFTRKYCAAAHKYCADKGVAPTLHAAEILPGGWFMVVMDYLDESLYEPFEPPNHANQDQLQTRVTRVMNILHDGGFVHGDFRDANLMIQREGSVSDESPGGMILDTDDNLGVMLLDFDWAGKIGEARYPPNVNHEGIRRPTDAVDGKLIAKEHDSVMIDYMFAPN